MQFTDAAWSAKGTRELQVVQAGAAPAPPLERLDLDAVASGLIGASQFVGAAASQS
jgi:hypothetical protein